MRLCNFLNNFTHVYKVIINRKRNFQAKSLNFAETEAVFRLMNNRVARGKTQTRINLKKQICKNVSNPHPKKQTKKTK